MPFDHGPVTFRVCRLPDPLPEDALDRFARDCAGPLERVRGEPQWGWVSGRHLLETRIDEETALPGGFMHLALRQAERKIPASLLRAECRMAELAYEAEHEKPPGRKERKQIKEEITERLLPQMPPHISGTAFVIDHTEQLLYVAASSESATDTFAEMFRRTIGFEPVPLTPECAALELAGIDPRDLPGLNFSPDVADANVGGSLGQNFLTWLWYFQEDRDGILPPSRLGQFSLLVDGPLSLVAEGPGAYESVIRRGAPTVSAEAKAALLVGKKLRKARLTLAKGGEAQGAHATLWTAVVDADLFVFRGVKLPEGEAVDRASAFEERVQALYVFQKVFFALFERFLKIMTTPDDLADLRKRAKQWVQQRDGK